jgi:N-acetylglucosamine malate deacetylase 1
MKGRCRRRGDQSWYIIIYSGKTLSRMSLVDISGYMDKKLASVKAYKTQFYDENSKEPSTPISSDNFLDSITYRARDLGRLIGYRSR